MYHVTVNDDFRRESRVLQVNDLDFKEEYVHSSLYTSTFLLPKPSILCCSIFPSYLLHLLVSIIETIIKETQFLQIEKIEIIMVWLVYGLWCLTPLSTIFK